MSKPVETLGHKAIFWGLKRAVRAMPARLPDTLHPSKTAKKGSIYYEEEIKEIFIRIDDAGPVPGTGAARLRGQLRGPVRRYRRCRCRFRF